MGIFERRIFIAQKLLALQFKMSFPISIRMLIKHLLFAGLVIGFEIHKTRCNMSTSL